MDANGVIHSLTSASRTREAIGGAGSPQNHLHAAWCGLPRWEGSVRWSGSKPGLEDEWSKAERECLAARKRCGEQQTAVPCHG